MSQHDDIEAVKRAADGQHQNRRPTQPAGYDGPPAATDTGIHPAWLEPGHPDAPRYTHAEIGTAEPPRLGEMAEVLRGWRNDGVSAESAQYALSKVWYDADPVLLNPRIERERDRLLAEAGNLISGDREDTYGSAVDDFTRTGKMWAAVLGLPEVTAEQVAICMALVKVGRLCNTPNHRDSWVDLIGYAALGGDISQMTGRYL